jgi:uncharacterized protein (TIGR00251 family)
VSDLEVRERSGAVRFSVRVQPRAARSGVAGLHGGALRVRLSAPPVDGAANEELVELLAERLGVPRRDVSIVGGAASRSKLVEVRGVSAELVRSLVTER